MMGDKSAKQEAEDVFLSRYSGYLVIQNANPSSQEALVEALTLCLLL